MNDAKEVTNFVNTIKKRVCKRLDTIKEKEFKQQKNRASYIMSFSCNYDDAVQWERYADSAREVCTGFNDSKNESCGIDRTAAEKAV